MNLKIHKPSYQRRRSDTDSWENTIDSLAMALCSAAEWKDYEKQLQYVAWKVNKHPSVAKVSVFPVWRKYRKQAVQVAMLYNTVPFLRYLPLSWVRFLVR